MQIGTDSGGGSQGACLRILLLYVPGTIRVPADGTAAPMRVGILG